MTRVKSCWLCPNYGTEACVYCQNTQLSEYDEKVCPVCGGHLEGDGYTIPRHCENVDYPTDAEPDSGPYYCEVSDGIYPDPNAEEIPF